MKACLLALFAAIGAAVAPASAATLFFDFGNSGQLTPAAANYNNFVMNPPVTGSIANAIDSTGAPTSIGAAVSGFFNGSNTSGTSTPAGAAAAVFHPQATRDNAFGHAGVFGTNPLTPEGTVAFTGLDPATPYTFTIFASRMDTGATPPNRESRYVATGGSSGSALLNVTNNTSNVVQIQSVFPTPMGTIDLKVTPGPANSTNEQFYFLGAVRLEAVPEPSAALSAVIGVLGLLGRRLR